MLQRIRNAVAAVTIAANVVGTLVLFALVLAMNTDVIARGVFHAPFRGFVEIVIFLLILIVFLQLPDVVRSDRLTRSDGFLVLLQGTNPRLMRIARRIIDGLAAVFMMLIAWTVWPEFVEAFESCHFFSQPEFGPPPSGEFWKDLSDAMGRCDYFGTPGILTAPWWPARLAIFFGVSLSALIFAIRALFGDAGAARQPEPAQ